MQFIKSHYGDIPVYITENGFSDAQGNLDDMQREYYYKHNINQLLKGRTVSNKGKKYFQWKKHAYHSLSDRQCGHQGILRVVVDGQLWMEYGLRVSRCNQIQSRDIYRPSFQREVRHSQCGLRGCHAPKNTKADGRLSQQTCGRQWICWRTKNIITNKLLYLQVATFAEYITREVLTQPLSATIFITVIRPLIA